MSATIISLKPSKNEIPADTEELDAQTKAELLSLLDDVRASVETGETLSLVFIEISRSNEINCGYLIDNRSDPFQIVGALEIGKADVFREFFE